MNGIQSKNHKMGTCEINEVSLSCFDNKIFVLNKGDDGLAIKILLIFSLVRRAFSLIFLFYFT